MRCASYPPGKLRGPSKMKPPIRIVVLHFSHDAGGSFVQER
jgi:hypothetical protein